MIIAPAATDSVVVVVVKVAVHVVVVHVVVVRVGRAVKRERLSPEPRRAELCGRGGKARCFRRRSGGPQVGEVGLFVAHVVVDVAG